MAKAPEYNPADNFTLAETEKAYRSILRIVGERGTGKSRLIFTGPEPIFQFSFDQGEEGVVEDFASTKEIQVRDYDWDPNNISCDPKDYAVESKKYAVEIRDHYEADLAYAIAQGAKRKKPFTIGLDKETDLWLLYRYAEFGGPSDAPKNYEELNRRYISMLNKVKSCRYANLIVVQGMKDEWGTVVEVVNGQKKKKPYQTGRRVPSGFDRIDEIVFAEIMTHRTRDEAGVKFWFDFKADFDPEFGKCRQNAQLSGKRLPAMPLPELGTFLIDGSEPEEWS
mgnify:CR=1 FL=1